MIVKGGGKHVRIMKEEVAVERPRPKKKEEVERQYKYKHFQKIAFNNNDL